MRQPVCRTVGRNRAVLEEDYLFFWTEPGGKVYEIIVPRGFEFYASVPRLLTLLAAQRGELDGPSAVHDYIYTRRGRMGDHFRVRTAGGPVPVRRLIRREEADRIFLRAMEQIPTIKPWRRDMAYWAVKNFGARDWRD